MKATFIETRAFTQAVRKALSEREYSKIQSDLMERPHLGTPIPGCGGIAKFRWEDPRRGKGKRGGIRIIYLHIPIVSRFYLLDLYDKDAKEDLNPDEKKVLSQLALKLKSMARAEWERRKDHERG